MTSSIFTSVASAVSTAAILYMARVIYKARQTVSRLANEHRFLMRSMAAVLKHLDMSP